MARRLDSPDCPADTRESLPGLQRALYSVQSVMNGGGPGGDLRGMTKPPPSGPYLSLMLGPATNVQLSRTEARLRLKEEYYEFRDYTTPIYIAFPIVLLFLHRNPPTQKDLGRLGADLPPSLAQIIFPFTLQARPPRPGARRRGLQCCCGCTRLRAPPPNPKKT